MLIMATKEELLREVQDAKDAAKADAAYSKSLTSTEEAPNPKKSAGAGRGNVNPTSSGYSEGDEADAKKYRATHDAATIKSLGEAKGKKAISMGSSGNAENNWKENTKTSEGREMNKKNIDYVKSEAGMKRGGTVKKMAGGGVTRADGCCSKGHTKGRMV